MQGIDPLQPSQSGWDRLEKGNLGPLGRYLRQAQYFGSDEIHAEMAYPQYTHYPFASVSDTAASCSVTFMAPSKTFNIAGIVTSYAIVPNDRIREEFYSFLEAGEFGDGTIFAYTATTAAYTYGAEWLQQMRMYIMENVRFVD